VTAVAGGGTITITITTVAIGATAIAAITMEVVVVSDGALETTITRDGVALKNTRDTTTTTTTTVDHGSRDEEIPRGHHFQQIQHYLHLPHGDIRSNLGEHGHRIIHKEGIILAPLIVEVGIVVEEWGRMDLRVQHLTRVTIMPIITRAVKVGLSIPHNSLQNLCSQACMAGTQTQ
jgi:hypothetical protein